MNLSAVRISRFSWKLAALFYFISAQLAHGDWSTYQGNERHTGYVPGTFDMSAAKLLWQNDIGISNISFAIGGDTVLVSEATRSIHESRVMDVAALDQATGNVLWRKEYPGYHALSGPAYADGIAYVQINRGSGSSLNAIHAFAVRSGEPIFQAPYQAQWQRYVNPTPYDGIIYAGGGLYDGLHAYDAATGTPKWFSEAPKDDTWTPTIDGDSAYMYGCDNGVCRLTITDRIAGATMASVVDSGGRSLGSAYLEHGAIALGSSKNGFSINNDRLIAWNLDVSAESGASILWTRPGGYSGQATVANGRIFADFNQQLHVLDETTGQLLWSWKPPIGTLIGEIISTDNLVFVSSRSTPGTDAVYTTFAIDLESRNAVWSFPASGELAIADNTLFIGDERNVVYAIALPEPSSCSILVAGSVAMAMGLRSASRKYL